MPARSVLLLTLCLLLPGPFVQAQADAPCGVVDTIGYPVDGLAAGYDDFGRHRARFGGNHVGIDLAFDRRGDPVRAAMRGIVSYSDVAGWDSEKGVVIVAHRMPDDSLVYTLYGHMEQSDGLRFPAVGDCVTEQTVLGGIGWPSRGRPHLHYEIRNILPDEGGPGYIDGDPLATGWYHPLAFTSLWQLRLAPGFLASTSFSAVPTLPVRLTGAGGYVLASGERIMAGVLGQDSAQWQVEAGSNVQGLAALPDGRVVAHTRAGQAMTLAQGRYEALWQVAEPDAPFQTLGETLVFALQGGALDAFNAAGERLWQLPPFPATLQLSDFVSDGTLLAIGLRDPGNGILWRLVDAEGVVRYQANMAQRSLLAPAGDGTWLGLDGQHFFRIADGQRQELATLAGWVGSAAAITMDMAGNSYLYLGGGARSLLSLDAQGSLRWRVDWPGARSALPPLLDNGSGCLLYALDARGGLSLIDTADGSLLRRIELYAGGSRNSSPQARLLQVDVDERIQVSSGFLALVTLDGWVLGGDAMQGCLLG